MPAHPAHESDELLRALASSEVHEAGAVLRKWSGCGALTATPALVPSC